MGGPCVRGECAFDHGGWKSDNRVADTLVRLMHVTIHSSGWHAIQRNHILRPHVARCFASLASCLDTVMYCLSHNSSGDLSLLEACSRPGHLPGVVHAFRNSLMLIASRDAINATLTAFTRTRPLSTDANIVHVATITSRHCALPASSGAHAFDIVSPLVSLIVPH